MKIPQAVKRFYLHFLRYRTPFFVSMSFITVVTFVFAAVYPGEEALSQFVTYLAFLATVEVENAGFYFWLLFVNALMLTIYPALISVFLGVNLLPFSEKDGKELLVTSAKSTAKFYLENSILLVSTSNFCKIYSKILSRKLNFTCFSDGSYFVSWIYFGGYYALFE
jgi:hypothetical protein